MEKERLVWIDLLNIVACAGVLLLKNYINIGSKNEAENSTFTFSLIKGCKLNNIDSQDYLRHLVECILHGKDCDRKTLLPCFNKS